MRKPNYQVRGELHCYWPVGKCRIKIWPGWRLQRNSLLKYQLVEDAKSKVEMVVMDDHVNPTSPLLNKADLDELGQCDGREKKELVNWVSQWGLLGAEPKGRQSNLIGTYFLVGEGGLGGPDSAIAYEAEPLAIQQDCAKIAKVATDLFRILTEKSGMTRAPALKDLLKEDPHGLKIDETSKTPPQASWKIRGVDVGMHYCPSPQRSEEWSKLGVQALSYLVEQALEENISIRLAAHSTRAERSPFKYYWRVKTLWGALFLKLVTNWQKFNYCKICQAIISSRAETCSGKCRTKWQRANASK